uniref:uncharacterized protein LOC122582657 n=1 Tax=Erigeron canadensis TaxID=72917 RepID=UPI001CB991D2|nr:uncharacterized protein LOC122582657 [Erigeron canadensis]
MVAKMKKWSPWQHNNNNNNPQQSATSKKYRVKVERIKLEGLFEYGGGEKVMGIEVKWKGGGGDQKKRHHQGFGFRKKAGGSSGERTWFKEIVVKKGEVVVWEEEDDINLENVCQFLNGDGFNDDQHYKLFPWILKFKFTYGEHNKGKMAEIGKVSLNLAEFTSKIESPVIEKKLPVDLQIAGLTTQATVSVLLSFVEIRDSGELVPELTLADDFKAVTEKKKLSLEEVFLSDSDNSVTFDSDESSESQSSSSVTVQAGPDKKAGLFDWKRPRLNLKLKKPKIKDSRPPTLFSGDSRVSGQEHKTLTHNTLSNTWETREFISRDRESVLNTQSFFASFDQCSDKAAGPSACTALVTVIAHWLGSNDSTTMPTVEQFDNLIIDGSSEWRNLCENVTHVAEFPDKHFDLETVLRAGIRPISVSRENSFVGFFSPEKFDSLTGVMSFDDIWDNEISQSQGVYIVSWNDHFFVLKADEDGYYIIDTLGERLVEGCNQAYILRFDNGSYMTHNRTGKVICQGKDCCKEFIKMFLAAIPLKELEIEEQKQAVPYYSLHHRLQIEFNFCSMA